MSFLYVLLLGMLSLFFLSYLLSDRDILSPSTMMTIMFSISSLFAILNIRNWNIDYNVNAGLITITGVFVFIVSEMIMKNFFIRSRKQIIDQKLSYETKFVGYSVRHWKLYLLIIINTLIIIWYFLQIRSLVGGGNISAMFQEYRRIGVNQLEGRDVDSVGGMITHLLKIVEGSGYVASYLLISNVIYRYKKHRTNFLLLILIFLSILPSTFGAGRTQVLKLLSAMLIEYYILWHQKNGWFRNLSWKMIRLGVTSLLIGIPLFYYSLSLLGRSTSRTLFDYISDYIASGIVLFSKYIESPVPVKVWGEESLFSLLKIFNYLGFGEKSTSYNLEFRPLGIGLSNIYTFFRRPLHDFGLLGMYIFVALIAILFAYIYYGKIKYRAKSLKTARWTLVYGYLYYWIVSSSIIQYSSAYISAGTIIILFVIIFLYSFLSDEGTRIRLRWK